MKKIIIAAAIVCTAVLSQAAAFQWNASGVLDPTGKTLYSGSATLTAYALAGGALIDTWIGSMNGGTIATEISSDKLLVNTNYRFVYTMTDSATGAEFTSSPAMGRGQQSTAPSLSFGSAGSWTNVPEPTSGLLMLLGVAGLALRRKQK